MTALYVLAQEHRALAERLADLEVDPQTIADTLEGEALPLEQKAIAVAMVARNFEELSESIRHAIDTMKKRQDAAKKRAEALRAYLLTNMLAAGIKSADSPMLCVSVKGKPASVEVFDAAQIPAEFFDKPPPPDPTLNKARVSAAIKAGTDVPGAKLSEQNFRLEIK
jgi:hypothetical protein